MDAQKVVSGWRVSRCRSVSMTLRSVARFALNEKKHNPESHLIKQSWVDVLDTLSRPSSILSSRYNDLFRSICPERFARLC